jgi:hypothetical protein
MTRGDLFVGLVGYCLLVGPWVAFVVAALVSGT